MKSYNSRIIPVLRDKTDKLYIADLDRMAPEKFPSDSAVRQLVESYRQDGNIEARDIIVTSFGRYVVSIAKNYQEQGLSLADLISEGMIGLMAAIEQFDTTQTSTKFVTYSNVSISRQMREALDQSNRPVKVPKNIRNSQMKIKEKLHSESLSGNEIHEVIDSIDERDQEFATNPKIFQRLSVTSQRSGEEEDLDPLENVLLLSVDGSAPMEGSDFDIDLARIFTKLTENEVKVIRSFYGFSGDYLKSSMKLIGQSLGMSVEQVRKLKTSGLLKLRDEKSKQILAKYL